MKGDYKPSIVCGLFCNPKVYEEFYKQVNNKFGMVVREIRFIDITMPVDKDYNKAVNFLKHFSSPILKRFLDFDFMGVKATILKKAGLKEIKLPTWEMDNRHKLLSCGLTPLFLDDKYCLPINYTPEEIENCHKLAKFESEGYKRKVTGVYEE